MRSKIKHKVFLVLDILMFLALTIITMMILMIDSTNHYQSQDKAPVIQADPVGMASPRPSRND